MSRCTPQILSCLVFGLLLSALLHGMELCWPASSAGIRFTRNASVTFVLVIAFALLRRGRAPGG